MKARNWLRETLSRAPISKKLVTMNVICLTVASLALSSYLIINTYRSMTDNSRYQSEREIADIANGFTQALIKQSETLNELAYFQPFIDYLDRDYESIYYQYVRFDDEARQWLEWLYRSVDGMKLKIYMPDSYQSVSSVTGGRLSQLKTTDWYGEREARLDGVRTACTWGVVSRKYGNALVYYKNVWNAAHTEVKRVVTVWQTSADLRRDIMVRDEARYYLVNPDGIIVSSNDSKSELRQLSDALPGIEIKDGAMVNIDGARHLSRRLDINLGEAGLSKGWQIIYLQGYEAISQAIYRQILTSAAICAAILGVALLLELALARDITGRLHILLSKIGLLARGDFEAGEEVPGADEIAAIGLKFDDMSAHIAQLLHDNEAAYTRLIEYERNERELVICRKNAEFQVLRAQINPHYLFNTLETIRMNLLINGQRETASIIRLFADTIREYMDVDRMNAPLSEELKYLESYMRIQRFRFGERVSYAEDVPEELAEYEIPRLILQPLVENAVAHGIDRVTRGGTVSVRARREGCWLAVRVSDDGAGMSANTLAALRRDLERDEGERLGLRNVNKRLTLLYGPEMGLLIESERDVGTSVTVRFRIADGREELDV